MKNYRQLQANIVFYQVKYMNRTKILLFMFFLFVFVSSAFGDVYTSHQKPNTDSTLDIGAAALLWRYIYGDSFTDGTALWDSSSLSGFTTISGTVLTDGTFLVTGGNVTSGTWNATDIDISDYTNLIGGTNITLSDDTLNVDDAFLVNDASDTTTGTIAAGGYTTTGTVGIGTVTPADTGWAVLQIEGADSAAGGPHVVFETDADTYPLMQLINYAHDNMSITFDAYYDGAHKSSDVGSNARIQKYGDDLLFRYDSGVAQGGAVTWNNAMAVDLTDGTVTTDIFVVGSNPPASTGSTGTAGTITYDASYIYVCVANNSWKRAALSTWAVLDVLLLDDGVDKLFLSDGASYLLIRP